MVRSELIERLTERYPQLTQHEAERVVAVRLEEITAQMADGGRTELRGFGVFEARTRQGREGRNPRTGEAVEVETKNVPFFRTGKALSRRLNTQRADEGSD